MGLATGADDSNPFRLCGLGVILPVLLESCTFPEYIAVNMVPKLARKT